MHRVTPGHSGRASPGYFLTINPGVTMGGRELSFADVVGDEEKFFRTYFNKKVLYRPRGITGDPRQILSIADMDDIVHQEGMRSSQLRMLGNGVPAIGDQLTSQLEMRREGKAIEDAVDPGKIYAHFRAGKTLIHGGLNLTRPNLRTLARSMTERFAAKSEIVAFLTPAGQRGATHSDPTDVYVIQLEGTKRWQIWPTPQVRRPGDDKYSFPSLPDPVLDVSLQPGDVLYVPHNTPHRASAEGSVSLHVTVVAGRAAGRTISCRQSRTCFTTAPNSGTPRIWMTPHPRSWSRKSAS